MERLTLCILMVVIAFIVGLFTQPILIPSKDEFSLYIQYLDHTVVLKNGSDQIDRILNESKNGNTTQRLTIIANEITENYSDYYWDKNTKYIQLQQYEINENGKIHIKPPYGDSIRSIAVDPNWLIYQKSGACRELSVLFKNLTQRSGFISRIIRTGDGYSNGVNATHWWNEIVIDGVNKTVDVQCYGLMKYEKSCPSWISNRSNFLINEGFIPENICNLGGIWVTDEYGNKIEDVTTDYLGEKKCI